MATMEIQNLYLALSGCVSLLVISMLALATRRFVEYLEDMRKSGHFGIYVFLGTSFMLVLLIIVAHAGLVLYQLFMLARA
jgi:predicted dinucleotide-utilizing enzyme